MIRAPRHIEGLHSVHIKRTLLFGVVCGSETVHGFFSPA